MELQETRQHITGIFKINGYNIRKEASLFLAEHFQHYHDKEKNEWIQKIIEQIRRQDLLQPIIEKKHVEEAYKECNSTGSELSETTFNVIDTFRIPKFIYNFERKKFLKDNGNSDKTNLFPSPLMKSQYLIDRYNVIFQRTVRNKLFAPSAIPGSNAEKVFTLQKIECLLSCSSRIDEVISLGILTQLTEGTYYLEDPTGAIALDLTSTRYHSGLFTECCFVLAEGYYEDKILHVMGLVMPPAESRETSQIYFGNINTFGGPSKLLLKNSETLAQMERDNEDAMIIFLSDVWFDSLKVMTKLKSLFSGYNEFPPTAIVFMGEFLSCPYGYDQSNQLKSSLKSLADMISLYPHLLQSTKFVFVPGASDPAAPNILPRLPLPEFVTEDIRKKLGDSVIFASNPCRIQYCTQEIVVLRHDLVTKMCRNAIHFPETGDIPDHFTKTLVSQCTLAPLPLEVQPIFWQHSDALSLYPIPDLVVIADHFQPFTRSYQTCQFINPGSFPKTEFSFKVYMPSSKTVEDSQIPDED